MSNHATRTSATRAGLNRLGLAAPPPFVGRTAELRALEEAVTDSVLLVVSGNVGSGKTRLVSELCRRKSVQALKPVFVSCRPGDRGDALRARAERELGILPGTLDAALRRTPRLLVIDDAHHLADSPDTLRSLATEAGAGRVLLIASERLPLRRAQSQRFEMVLEGLDEASARELWGHLEERFGAVPSEACDQALIITGGLPMALRREFARARAAAANPTAKTPASDSLGSAGTGALSDSTRAVAEAIAIIDMPITPAGIASLVESAAIEDALIELVEGQLIDSLPDGRFVMHAEVSRALIEQLQDRRKGLEAAAAEKLSNDSDGGSLFGLLDRVDRLRECARHWLAAGVPERAVELLERGFDEAAARGSAGEITALARTIEVASPELAERLRRVRARAARRQGHVASALELGGVGDPVTDAWLRFQAGEVDSARQQLADLASSAGSPDSENGPQAALATARLVRIEIDAGEHEVARGRLASVFNSGISNLPDSTRAHLHLAMATVAAADGDSTSARASLARARGVGNLNAELIAVVDVHRVELLVEEGRTQEAEQLLDRVGHLVAQLDMGVLFDQVRRARARLAERRGDLVRATDELRSLIARHRECGAEVPALRSELALAEVMIARGELRDATELAGAARAAASALGLGAMVARTQLLKATIDLMVLRTDSADDGLASCLVAAQAAVRRGAAQKKRLLAAWNGLELPPSPDSETEVDSVAARGRAIDIAVAQRDMVGALQLAREQAAAAESAGRDAAMVTALAVLARLQLARGDRAGATAAASRAARTALRCGMTAARANALLVLAALARDNNELISAQAYAQDALNLASSAGLPLERLAASRAMEVISVGDSGGVGQVPERESAAAAAMSDKAVESTAQLLTDLGLTAARPFRVISAQGQESFVADASPSVLRMEERGLVIDAVREVIVRAGSEVADLRRRSLLKRLLFLFASNPNKVFSKEEIVQTVWEVEYHPLRHDAALFTNIMRIRRLLGKEGADLIRVSDEGYRFCPDKDFLYVENVET